jgi:hypothetical protein
MTETDTFEEACRKADAEIAAKKANGRATALLELKTILDEVHAFLGRFVIYPSKEAHDAHVLWIAHTHTRWMPGSPHRVLRSCRLSPPAVRRAL